MTNRIIVPTDSTSAAGIAIRQAAAIAGKTGSGVTLLHIVQDRVKESAEEAKLQEEAARVRKETGVACDAMIREGTIFDAIPRVVCEHEFDLMVIATHGARGIRQKLFGADILRLVSKIAMPVLVVQEESTVIESFRKIVLPVSSHKSFRAAVDAVLYFGKIYPGLEVHFYSIFKPGFEWPEQILRNIEETTLYFKENGITLKRIKEDQSVYSPGYAKQTLKYAESEKADTVCIMSIPSEEYYYFAQADKESLLLKGCSMPVLFAGGGC